MAEVNSDKIKINFVAEHELGNIPGIPARWAIILSALRKNTGNITIEAIEQICNLREDDLPRVDFALNPAFVFLPPSPNAPNVLTPNSVLERGLELERDVAVAAQALDLPLSPSSLGERRINVSANERLDDKETSYWGSLGVYSELTAGSSTDYEHFSGDSSVRPKVPTSSVENRTPTNNVDDLGLQERVEQVIDNYAARHPPNRNIFENVSERDKARDSSLTRNIPRTSQRGSRQEDDFSRNDNPVQSARGPLENIQNKSQQNIGKPVKRSLNPDFVSPLNCMPGVAGPRLGYPQCGYPQVNNLQFGYPQSGCPGAPMFPYGMPYPCTPVTSQSRHPYPSVTSESSGDKRVRFEGDTESRNRQFENRGSHRNRDYSPELRNRQSEYRGSYRNRDNSPDIRLHRIITSMPRCLSFDGTDDWLAFKRRFLTYVNQFRLSNEESLTCLTYALSGNALKLYTSVDDGTGSLNLHDLLMTLEGAYGDIDSDELALAEFNVAEQNSDESLQKWSERIRLLGAKAFRHDNPAKANKSTIEKFCMGLQERAVGRAVLLHDHPQTLVEAVRLVQRHLNIDLIYPVGVKRQSRVRFCSPEYLEDSESDLGVSYDVRAIRQQEQQRQTPTRFSRALRSNSPSPRPSLGNKNFQNASSQINSNYRQNSPSRFDSGYRRDSPSRFDSNYRRDSPSRYDSNYRRDSPSRYNSDYRVNFSNTGNSQNQITQGSLVNPDKNLRLEELIQTFAKKSSNY